MMDDSWMEGVDLKKKADGKTSFFGSGGMKYIHWLYVYNIIYTGILFIYSHMMGNLESHQPTRCGFVPF